VPSPAAETQSLDDLVSQLQELPVLNESTQFTV
jgi:hypothetical protein